MPITWRRLVGSTDRFAIEVSLVQDPHEGRGASQRVAESWGEFKFFVDGKNLCEARDSTGTLLEGVRWYLLPVLRFFVGNWEEILHRGRLPRISRSGSSAATQMASIQFPPLVVDGKAAASWSDEWWQYFTKHCLASEREGGLFPNVWVRRVMDDVEVSWDNDANPAESPIRFLERSGVALVPAAEFAEVVGHIAGAALEELKRRVEHEELVRLRDELHAIGNPSLERRWLRQSLLLDLRRDIDEAVRFARHLAEKFPKLLSPDGDRTFAPATLPSLVFSSASPNINEQDALRILVSFEAAGRQVGPTRLDEVKQEVPCPYTEPWKSGYDLAFALREKLALGLYEPIDMERAVQELGIDVREIELADPSIRAISFVDDGITPTILVNARSPRTLREWARAATLAHEVCHLAFESRIGRRLGIASGPWAPVRFEQRANAFAVMFLMPELGVVDVFKAARGDLAGRVKAVARYFGSSYRAAVEHLSNLALIERYERDTLLEYLETL